MAMINKKDKVEEAIVAVLNANLAFISSLT
jgi:hypothetical protein